MLPSRSLAVSFSLPVALLALACASPKVEPEPKERAASSATSEPERVRTGSLASAAPSESPSAAPADSAQDPAPADSAQDPEARERENAGCKFRKSTNKLSACAKHSKNLGAWTPTEAEFAEAATKSRGACYCVTGLDELAKTCMQRMKSSQVTFTVGTLDDATDCTVTIASAESQQRRFLRVHAAVRDVATFYATLSIYERKASSLASYFVGFNGINEADVAAGEEGVSADMKREWKSLPADLRKWMATD